MLRRVPPVVLAAVATAVVVGVVIAVVVLTGNAAGRSVGPCTDALEAGPYGCTVFVSLDGADGDAVADEPAGGAISYRVERAGGRDRLVWTGGCGGGRSDVAVGAARYRVGATARTRQDCDAAAGAVDEWAAGLFAGTVQVDDRDDGTVLLVHGRRSARFSQVVAARG